MSLTQAEADRLLQLPKGFVPSIASIDFPECSRLRPHSSWAPLAAASDFSSIWNAATSNVHG